ncbi:MAG: EAL domain-containing protein (putative c-di-GMP-specific phosphodiesterase class I), partial [Gammaproteobacteria bacterium]
DEFGIILPFLEIEQALLTIQEVIIEIQHTPFLWKGKEYEVGASVGVIAFGHMEDEYSDFYSKVTTACFLAKQNGGSQYHSIEENDQKVIAQQESRDWVSGIMKGLTEDSFKLYVQPIVPLDEAHNERHYEVLIRYQAEDGSIVSPNHFLPTAERYNLIEKIDRWVVNKTLEWLQANKASVDDTLFSINLSGRSIGSRTFHKFLQNRLEQSDVDTTSLCFEITETSVVDNIERSVEFINAIKKLGAKFSLDDFGTGLSSFSYLKQFPVDYLKIDGEFIRDIIEDDTSFVFVRSMSEVGHCLEMKVIAEYVESSDMFDKLRAANIDFIQGYTVGRPVDIQSLEILP